MKKGIFYLLVLPLCVYITCCGSQKDDSIKVGAIVFLTGESSSLGVPLLNGLKYAEKYINNNGGINGRRIELIIEDSQSSAKGTLSAFNKLVMNNVTSIIVTGDNEFRAINELAKKNSIPIIATACTGGIEDRSKWVLRYCYSEQSQDRDIANFIYNDLKYRRMALIYPNSLYGQDIYKYTKKYFEELGGEIIAHQAFLSNEGNQRNTALSILRESPEIICVRGIGTAFEAIIKSLRENGYKNELIGDITLGLPATIKNTQNYIGKIFYVAGELDLDSKDLFVQSYIQEYKNEYMQDPSFWDALGFDSLYYLCHALANVDNLKDKNQILDALYTLGPIKCLLGTHGFNQNGDLNFITSVFVMDELGVRVLNK